MKKDNFIVKPVVLKAALTGYSEINTVLDGMAWLSKVLPRGKVACNRWLGYTFLSDAKYFMRTRHDAKLVLSNTSLDVYTDMRIAENAWDYDDFIVCYKSVPDGGVFYDIGSNVGYFATEMLQLSNDAVKVVAIEPYDSLADAIAASAALNHFNNLSVYNALLGDRVSLVDFYVAPATIHSSAVADSYSRHTNSVKKPMTTLDALVAQGAPTPTMIKMDIEGSEHLALQGGAQILRTSRPHVYVEYLHYGDPDNRIRAELELLMTDTGCYDLYGSPTADRRARYGSRLFRMTGEEDWKVIDAAYLHNRDRPLRDEDFLG